MLGLVRIASVAAALLASNAVARAENNAALAMALDSITTDECYEHVAALADDVYEGRAAGSRGGHAAAAYILRQIEPLNFEPAGAGGKYVQPFGDDWRNILAKTTGSDSELRDEYIIVGAHYDHVGYGNRRNSFGTVGRIHNGADDNASGISVLLETMEAFAKSGITTRRSILFAFWDCEERGLVGSRYWAKHPTVSLEDVKLAVTLDMVGRLRKGQLYVLGSRSGYGMRRLFSGSLSDPGGAGPLWLDFSWELHENSDHWSFLERQIPVALVHTGLHDDYHRSSDDVDKVNREGMRDVSRYLFHALVKIANEDRLPKFRSKVTRDTLEVQKAFEEPLPETTLDDWPSDVPRPRLGIGWREDEAETGSVFLTRVVPGTPAETAGLMVHDRIYELNGRPFDTADAFQSEVTSQLDAGAPELSLLIERRGDVRTVVVPMGSEEGRVSSAESREPEQGDQGSSVDGQLPQ